MMLRKMMLMAVGAWLAVVGVGCGPQDVEEPGVDLPEMGGVQTEEPATEQQGLVSNVTATSTNITRLQNSCYSSGYLKWDRCSLGYGGQDLQTFWAKTALYIGTIKGTKVSNGECAAFVINVGRLSTMYATGWIKSTTSVMAMSSVAKGTAIATFDANGVYDGGRGGHSAIFHSYKVDSMGRRIGFYVWDANYNGNGAVMLHAITTGSAKYQQASQYYVVRYNYP